MIRNITNLCIIILTLIGGYWYYDNYLASCRYPVEYSIGQFDSEFGLSRDEFINIIRQAEDVWERPIGKNFFRYKPDSEFNINLIYDQRQAQSDAAEESEEKIEGKRATYDLMVSGYRSGEIAYDSNLKLYRSNVQVYEKNLSAYNTKVAQANQRGGARPSEFESLENERRDLEKKQAEIKQQQSWLTTQASELNKLAEQINSLARTYNFEITIHNQIFGTAREFEQGQFKKRGQSEEINIYQYSTAEDLKLVIAHEFGHALGLEHIENPESLMYYLLEKQDLNDPELTEEDLAELRRVCET